MSLDKFISRGYTSSVGDSSGKWVAQDPKSKSAHEFVPAAQSGTSFVLGSTPALERGAGSKQKAFEYKDRDYHFDSEEVRYHGSRREAPVASGCFGSRTGSGSNGSGTIDGHKAVVGIFMLAIFVGIAVILIADVGKTTPKAKNPRMQSKDQSAPNRSVPPLWYR